MYACKSIQRPTPLHWNCEKEIQMGYPYLTRTNLKKTKNYEVLILIFTLRVEVMIQGI